MTTATRPSVSAGPVMAVATAVAESVMTPAMPLLVCLEASFQMRLDKMSSMCRASSLTSCRHDHALGLL